MLEKILGGALAVALALSAVSTWRLTMAQNEVSVLTKDRDAALKDASNARQAQQEAEGQSRQWSARFDSLDGALQRLGVNQKANNDGLIIRLRELSNIQKTEGDSDETMQCLDRPVPVQLDRGLREGTGTGGGH